MKLSQAQSHFHTTLKQRNFAYVVSLIVGISNVALVGYILSREERILLIPQFDFDHQSFVTTSYFSDQYLIDWADGITRMVFTANPESVEKRVLDTLRIAFSGHGEIKKTLDAWVKLVKQDSLSTVFYPSQIDVDQGKKEVIVKGKMMSYFGSDRKPIIEEKIFLVGFEKGNKGALFLKSLMEKSHD